MKIEIDLDHHPKIEAEIERRAADMAAENEEDPYEGFADDTASIKDALETIRRLLTSPSPSPSEAMIYVERALETVAGMK